MSKTVLTPNISTALDITPEKKNLKLAIEEKEKQYTQVVTNLEQLKSEISTFQQLYESKVGHLYSRLNHLQNLLFKYEHISEYVDDLFSFSEAQKVFEDTMSERLKRMEEEFNQRNKVKKSDYKKNNRSGAYKQELRLLYRNLAHLFHPDKTGGDDTMMKQINKAYREGNLQELRALDLLHVTTKADDTLTGLQHRLSVVNGLIQKASKETVSLQRSEMYVLQEKTLKSTQTTPNNALEIIAKELLAEIARKEEQVKQFIEKFGIEEETTPIVD